MLEEAQEKEWDLIKLFTAAAAASSSSSSFV
jgi:hypothetical protein